MFGRWFRVAVAAAVATVTWAHRAWAHGYMSVPITRNLGDDCQHCLNAGGPGSVYRGSTWPRDGKFGVCGDDPFGVSGPAAYHEGGGGYEQKNGIRRTYYHAGDVIRVKGVLTATHKGYFQYFVCVLPPTSNGGLAERQFLTNACFKTVLKVQQNGAWGDRFYVGDAWSWDHPVQLPNFECPRCVMRWYYITGNSCTPPGTPSAWADSDLSICGQAGWVNPEEFWNCADISLLKKGAPLPAVSKNVLKGELSTGTSSSQSDPTGQQPIEHVDDPTAALVPDSDPGNTTNYGQGGSGQGGGQGNTIISFQHVAMSVVAGTGVGIPVVFLSPVIGLGAGFFVFAIALVFFMVYENRKK